MASDQLTITYVGGPTALLEFGGVRLLTDPTFDPAGGEYQTGPVMLRKLTGPGLSPQELGSIDYVLLSHDHHFDNLDHAGRALLSAAQQEHFSEGREQIARAFKNARLESRLKWLERGRPTRINLPTMAGKSYPR